MELKTSTPQIRSCHAAVVTRRVTWARMLTEIIRAPPAHAVTMLKPSTRVRASRRLKHQAVLPVICNMLKTRIGHRLCGLLRLERRRLRLRSSSHEKVPTSYYP